MKHRLFKLVLFLLLGAIVNVTVAWTCAAGSAWWGPMPSGGGESLCIDQATSLWRKCGGNTFESDRVLAVRIPGRWFDRILVLAERRGAISNMSELRMIHTSGWPLHSMFQSSQSPLQLRRIVFPRMSFEQASALDAKVDEARQFFKETRYADAAALFREALKMSDKLLGEEHPSSLTLMTSLARLSELEGQYTEAEALRRESLGVYRRIFGANNPRTAVNAIDLGLLLADQGRYDEATVLFIETLNILYQNPKFALVPIWPGFAFNTGFYAAILWLLTLGPFALRRYIRRRRGLCIKCGYDLRGAEHEMCPECGCEVCAGAKP